MPEKRKRNLTVTIRVTPGEKDAILRKAKQADSRTLCLPRRRSDGYNAPFPRAGEIPPVSVLLLSP